MIDRLRRFGVEISFAVVPALIAAALHLAIVTLRREVFGTFHWDWNTRDVGWMVPAGYLLVFALCSLPLAIVAGVRRAGLPVRVRWWFWSTLSLFSVLLLFTRVHSVAWLLVALGAGYQTTRWATAHSALWTRGVRRTGLALGMCFVAYAATIFARRAWQERERLGALPEAPSGAPNVVLIIWDTARAQNMSLYGYGRSTTPFLDSLGQHALVFEHAFATASWTLPSHASMLTGQYASAQSGDRMTPLDGAHRTLAEALYAHGYTTGAFVANTISASYTSGLHRGFTRFEDTKRTLVEALWSTTITQSTPVQEAYDRIVTQRWYRKALMELLRIDWRPPGMYQVHDNKHAESVTRDFLHWHASVRRPYFAMLNYMEAHGRHNAPTRTMFNTGASSEDEYDGSLWWLDRQLRLLVSEFARRGELERSILILTADHGEQLGEHGLRGHGNSLYATLLHVPLVIYAPGRPPGGLRISRAVSLRDLARTVQELAGVDSGKFPGASLAALATDPQAATSPVIAQLSKGINWLPHNPVYWGDMIAVLDDTVHVIRDGRGAIEAYAYRTDSGETLNLARDPVRRELAERWLAHVVRGAGLQY